MHRTRAIHKHIDIKLWLMCEHTICVYATLSHDSLDVCWESNAKRKEEEDDEKHTTEKQHSEAIKSMQYLLFSGIFVCFCFSLSLCLSLLPLDYHSYESVVTQVSLIGFFSLLFLRHCEYFTTASNVCTLSLSLVVDKCMLSVCPLITGSC